MSKQIAIYYGTMTGNSEGLAQDAVAEAKAAGWDATLYNLAETKADDLAANAANALFVVSTWGDGEPPSDAVDFFAELSGVNVNLDGHKHAVFGLGDSNYEQFNKFATDLDARLTELGSQTVLDVHKADVAFEDDFAAWKPNALAAFGE